MITPLYLGPTQSNAQSAGEVLFEQFVEFKRRTDPDAVTPEGEVMYRSPFTGELDPSKPRSRSWTAIPEPTVQGFTIWQPAHPELQLADPVAVGVEVVVNVNPWPTNESAPLPAWVQPTGAHDAYPLDFWCNHNGQDYVSLLPANVWEPTPQSNYWRASPDPGVLPWVQPTGAIDAYAIGDVVTHVFPGREDVEAWESNIAANTTEPGGDSTFDRWWKPIGLPVPEVSDWVQPMPGTANAPYEMGRRVLHNGKTWQSTVQLNVWEPGVYGWTEEGTQP